MSTLLPRGASNCCDGGGGGAACDAARCGGGSIAGDDSRIGGGGGAGVRGGAGRTMRVTSLTGVGSGPISTASRSAASSTTFATRFAASRSRQRVIRRSSAGGTSANWDSGGGGWVSTAASRPPGSDVAERPPARDHLEHHDGERVDVGAAVDLAADHLLGRHVIARADHLAGARQLPRVERAAVLGARGAEVEHLDEVVVVALLLDVEVRRLEIAVHHAARVRLDQRVAHRARDRDGTRPRHRAARLELLEHALAVEQLHDDVQRAVLGLAQLVRDHGVGVAQLGERVALAAEPRDHVRVAGVLGVQDLERDLEPGLDVVRAIDRAEPALRDALVDPEPAIEDRPDVRVDQLDRRLLLHDRV